MNHIMENGDCRIGAGEVIRSVGLCCKKDYHGLRWVGRWRTAMKAAKSAAAILSVLIFHLTFFF